MRNFITSLISFSLILIFLIGGIIFAFWRFGVFRQEPKLSEDALKIKQQTEYVQQYPFQEANNYLTKLNPEIIKIPEIATSEFGRSSLFEVTKKQPIPTSTSREKR